MTAYFCDRCGLKINPKYTYNLFSVSEGYNLVTADLCPSCLAQIKRMFEPVNIIASLNKKD